MVWIKQKLTSTLNEKTDKDWCVILMKPHPGVRNLLATKLVEAFSFSDDFAHELLLRGPIILVDHLTKEKAEALREFFAAAGGELRLTNDRALKRKCFRVQWQEEPNLDFLTPEKPADNMPLSHREKPLSRDAAGAGGSSEPRGSLWSEVGRAGGSPASESPPQKMMKPAKIYELEIRQLEEKLSAVTAELTASKEQLARLNQDFQAVSKIKEELAKSLEETQGSLEMMRKWAQMVENEKTGLEQTLEETRRQNAKMTEEMQASTQQLEEYRRQVELRNEELQDVKNKKEELQQAVGQLRQDMENIRHLNSRLEGERADLLRQAQELQARQESLEEELKKAWGFFDSMTDSLMQTIQTIKAEATSLRKI